LSEGGATYCVALDKTVCVGHGRCYELAPDIFDEDEAGYCVVIREKIPQTLLAQAQSGEANCPEGAIRVTRE
jgi:ferredoxin